MVHLLQLLNLHLYIIILWSICIYVENGGNITYYQLVWGGVYLGTHVCVWRVFRSPQIFLWHSYCIKETSWKSCNKHILPWMVSYCFVTSQTKSKQLSICSRKFLPFSFSVRKTNGSLYSPEQQRWPFRGWGWSWIGRHDVLRDALRALGGECCLLTPKSLAECLHHMSILAPNHVVG